MARFALIPVLKIYFVLGVAVLLAIIAAKI